MPKKPSPRFLVPFASFSIEAGVDNAMTIWVEDWRMIDSDFIDNDKDPAELDEATPQPLPDREVYLSYSNYIQHFRLVKPQKHALTAFSVMAQGRGRKPTQQPAPPRTAGHRAAPVNFCDDPGSGEEFNFTPLDEHSANEDVQHVQRPISPASVEPVAGSAASTRPVTPSEQASEPSWSRTAPDIDFFFEHRSKVPPKCCETKWKVPALASETGTAPAPPGHGTQRPPFSQEALIQHLLNFIVADDQLLLLLREDLEDKDIPRQTKMRKSIIKAWHAYFKVLKQELAMIQGDSSHLHQALQAIPIIRATKKQLLATQLHCARVPYEQYVPQVKQAQLIRDMKVRWDSLYFMINRFRKLRLAVEYFLSLPVNRELAKLRLTDMEWTVLQDFEIILGVPHQVQKIMSKECTPILSGAIPAFEIIDWATTYYKKMDDSPAYVIVMLSQFVMVTMQKYHDRLHGQVQQPTPGTVASQQQRRSWHDLAGQYRLEDMMDLSGASLQHVQGVEEQFESYENGPLSLRGTDIVVFWVIGDKTHPILYAMALDYLPIQASSVPSERVFSSSAETDTKRRNRIHPVLMEALQMLKFSFKQQQLNFTEGWAVTEDELEYYADDDEDAVDLLGKLTSEIMEDGIDIDEVIHVVGQDDED
ncbi:uncharacterized protein LACBIDRAFT_328295 [Laccaria bicolor S238N-H82]|uniref:Predicted protein n=1 Tax=Laccaria bicolor (strain S238N-H82 / ATCC MYA-4686) TaxID=486041 RepID=B0DEF9_LACBS|nr:uncharacterized protein LACBIDRAFT_328295 [Laccaria bicolor S238N-H82]EDR07026.1 predicted protein [Laccaria bicolor S238N-H82]|eukprot:XP_001882399.1 predicted protein [Laccaria bicolor S238N-H82]